MFYIEGTDIFLTRGDTAYLHVEIKDEKGSTYSLKDTDILTLTVRKQPNETKVYLKSVGDRNGNFILLPKDTENMYFGEYKYDIQLFINEEEIYTIIPVSSFNVLEEVTWN